MLQCMSINQPTNPNLVFGRDKHSNVSWGGGEDGSRFKKSLHIFISHKIGPELFHEEKHIFYYLVQLYVILTGHSLAPSWPKGCQYIMYCFV